MKLLTELHESGVILSVDGDELQVDAPAGVLTPKMRAAISEHKAELMGALRTPCAGCKNIRMHEVRIPRHGPTFMWHCAHGHLPNGFATPDLQCLRAPMSCLAADHPDLIEWARPRAKA